MLSQAMNGRRCVLAFSGSTILGATNAAAASLSDEYRMCIKITPIKYKVRTGFMVYATKSYQVVDK